jgi:glc operon protein GlcG
MNRLVRQSICGLTLAVLMSFAQAADISIADARRVMDAARAAAADLQAPGAAITIVDSGGNIVMVERLDNTFPAAAMISIGKARTAALFRRSTALLEETVNGARPAMMMVPETNYTPIQGGIPLQVDGRVIGAIGVSGARNAQQDEQIAVAAAAVLQKK